MADVPNETGLAANGGTIWVAENGPWVKLIYLTLRSRGRGRNFLQLAAKKGSSGMPAPYSPGVVALGNG